MTGAAPEGRAGAAPAAGWKNVGVQVGSGTLEQATSKASGAVKPSRARREAIKAWPVWAVEREGVMMRMFLWW